MIRKRGIPFGKNKLKSKMATFRVTFEGLKGSENILHERAR